MGDFLGDPIEGLRWVVVVDGIAIISESSRNFLVVLSAVEVLSVVILATSIITENVVFTGGSPVVV